jgi:hypothetical protein
MVQPASREQKQDAGPPGREPIALAAEFFPPLVYGWREVFVPLAMVVHNQHALVLPTAGLAVAATRLGVWLLYLAQSRRPPQQAALLAGLALIFLGLAPEEGPIGLLLWALFGLTWPILQARLTVLPSSHSWAALWLVLGAVLAGPLALGPGTWLVAAGCLAWAWAWRKEKTGCSETQPPAGRLDRRLDWIPLLFSLTTLTWTWLMPAWLLSAGMPVWIVGAAMAAGWLLRVVGGRLTPAKGHRHLSLLATALCVPTVLVLIWVATPAAATALIAIHGLLTGLVSHHPAIVRPETMVLPGPAQALGEVLGPLIGVLLLVIGGSTAVFVGAGGASTALAAAMVLGTVRDR